MATYRVGQSVRVVKAPMYPQFVGTVAVIVSTGPVPFREYGVRCVDGKDYYCDSCHIEPAQKSDGNRIVSWKECPWMPEHMREVA